MILKLGNTSINKVYLGNTEVKKTYLGGGGFDSGLLINGTFDDSIGVEPEGSWSVGSGVLYFSDGGTSYCYLGLISNISDSTNLRLELDLDSEGTEGRFDVLLEGVTSGNTSMTGFTTYTEGHLIIDFTWSGGEDAAKLVLRGSVASPNAFSVDNMSLKIL